MPKAPSNFDEFQQQAQAFITKARAEGKNDNGIANTLRFMYQMTMDNMASQQDTQMTPHQQAQEERLGKGTWSLKDTNNDGTMDTEYNTTTGESRPYSASGGQNDIFLGIEADGDTTTTSGGLDTEGNLSLDDLFNNTSSQQETPQFGADALKKIAEVDNPTMEHLIPNTDPESRDKFMKGSDISLKGLNLQGEIFGQEEDPNRLNIAGGKKSPFIPFFR